MKRTLTITLVLSNLLHSTGANAQGLTLSLAPSNYNGYHISCYGGNDGALDLTISGGTPPYSIEWSTSATTEDISNLGVGYYRVGVSDANAGFEEAEFTLVEPDRFTLEMLPHEWPNGFNISCYNCYNGSIQVSTAGGAGSYTYEWSDGPTTEDRTALGSGNYSYVVTDANGCEERSEIVFLAQPESNDWKMGGNVGTNPATHFIGTTDNNDVVFKTNGAERFRLLGNGEIKFAGLGNGFLKSSGGLIAVGPWNDAYPQPYEILPFWSTTGNYLDATIGVDAFLGTKDNRDLKIRTNNIQRMRVKDDGRVAIGDELTGCSGMLNIKAGWTDWLTLYSADDQGNDIGLWRVHNRDERDALLFYYTPNGGPSTQAFALWTNGKVSIGDVSTDTPDYDYGLYLWKGLLTERVKVALKTTTEWSDHVFRSNYALMPLEEVEAFIEKNGHLPGVPSAECMVEDGLDVVKTDAMLMEKVEELTLHAIELNKRLERTEQIIRELTERLLPIKQ